MSKPCADGTHKTMAVKDHAELHEIADVVACYDCGEDAARVCVECNAVCCGEDGCDRATKAEP